MTRRLDRELYAPSRLEPLLEAMARDRHGLFETWAHRRLRLLFSDFDVNAWLGMYPMTYLTTEEWRGLLPEIGGKLVDVGAGSGDLTRALAPLYDAVSCTETSKGMAKRLRRQGFAVHRVDLAESAPEGLRGADAVALLHVLDRCRAPFALFERALALLRPGGIGLVAIPLPYAPLVYRGRRSEAPAERLLPEGLDARAEEGELERRLVTARGLELLVSAKVPYLCPGDLEAPYYQLDSRLLVFRKP